jgi:hypothetical protein
MHHIKHIRGRRARGHNACCSNKVTDWLEFHRSKDTIGARDGTLGSVDGMPRAQLLQQNSNEERQTTHP